MSATGAPRTAPLSRRILLVTLAGGVIVALVASALALPLIRNVARDQARIQLVRAVESLADRPAASAKRLAQEQRALGPDARRFVVVRRNGETAGDAVSVLTPDQINTLLTTGRLSTSASIDGEELLIEGRTTRRGFAAVAIQPVGAVDEATTAFLRRLVLALLIGLAAAGTLGVILSRTLTRSVADAASVARRLAGGERGMPPATSTVREIDDMSRAMTALDEALIASEGRQREFLLSISHEIRTPLTALRGYAEALADGAIEGQAEVRATGKTLVAETARLDNFVADLLALARLEADDFTLEPVDVDLARLVADLEAVWRPTFAAAEVRFIHVVADLAVWADPMRLRQLLDGLIENAIRATPSGGSVSIEVRATDRGVEVAVSDDGPGLAPSDIEVAFDRGELRRRYGDDRPVGTGLGLSIARSLAGRMGAELSVRPDLSGGSVFALCLPID